MRDPLKTAKPIDVPSDLSKPNAKPSPAIKFKRVLLKLTGEAMAGEGGFGINSKELHTISGEISEIYHLGVEVVIVIGGGNLFRGSAAGEAGIDRVTADYMGMIATVMNGLALQAALEGKGIETRMLSAIEMRQIAEPYVRRRALRHLEKKRIIILAGGTGNPYFTTDTAASLRATEMGVDVILKATKVDGVYTADPMKDKTARKFTEIKYIDVLTNDLEVMDAAAITLCRQNKIPVIVFNMLKRGNMKRVLTGEKIGTIVRER
jgi:uridylate kinase